MTAVAPPSPPREEADGPVDASTPRDGAMARWRRIGWGKRLVLVLVGAVVLVYGVQVAAESVVGGGNPGGPTSSSYATGGDGYAALADLLAQRGHPVTHIRKPLGSARLDPNSTVVVADPDRLEPSDAEALVTFVAKGGRLVVAGQTATPLLSAFSGSDVTWSSKGVDTAAPLVPSPESNVDAVAASGSGSFEHLGALLPVLGGDGRVVVATGSGATGGSVVGLADASVLSNDRLGSRDNAALALELAGPAKRPVAFVESVHGYGTTTGLSALPPSWKWAGLGLLLAALVAMWAAGQRFGPPEKTHRDLAPPRRAYVDALAADLARADPDPARAQALVAGARAPDPPPRGGPP